MGCIWIIPRSIPSGSGRRHWTRSSICIRPTRSRPRPCWTATTGCGGRPGNGLSRPVRTPCASCSEACSIASRARGSHSGIWAKPCRSCSGVSTAARDPIFTRSSSRGVRRNTSRTTSWWQVKARIIVGVATVFDAFDALAIASVLPVIVPLWKLTPPQIGLMISAGFLGQLLGALLFGWIAERYGRMTAMIWSIALFAVMSLACAFAWDYDSLLLFRVIQGIGLGGEVPVAAVFISELARAEARGRFVLLYELVFPIGLVSVALVGLWIVPRFGWQWMFVIGALPAFLALALRSLLPESPRWLAVRGRGAE